MPHRTIGMAPSHLYFHSMSNSQCGDQRTTGWPGTCGSGLLLLQLAPNLRVWMVRVHKLRRRVFLLLGYNTGFSKDWSRGICWHRYRLLFTLSVQRLIPSQLNALLLAVGRVWVLSATRSLSLYGGAIAVRLLSGRSEAPVPWSPTSHSITRSERPRFYGRKKILLSDTKLVFVLDSLMAEEQNTAVVEEVKDDHQEKKNEVEEPPAFKVETPVQKWQRPILLKLTESPEVVAEMALQLTTAKTETDTLIGAIREISIKSENDQESTSQLIKVMLLGLEAQRSISQIGSIEMKQVAVKQLDLLRHVAAEFSDQTEILQTLSDDIGANLNRLAQSFVKLSDVIKKGYKRRNWYRRQTPSDAGETRLTKCVFHAHQSGKVSIKGGSLIATVNRNLAELLERYPADLASVADEVTKAVKSLEGVRIQRGLQRAHQIQFLSNPNGWNISILKQRRNMRGQKQREINKWHLGG